MIKMTKRFQGSYTYTSTKYTYDILTAEQAGHDTTDKYWVAYRSDDFNGDYTARFTTKKQAVEYVNKLVTTEE